MDHPANQDFSTQFYPLNRVSFDNQDTPLQEDGSLVHYRCEQAQDISCTSSSVPYSLRNDLMGTNLFEEGLF